MKYLDESSLNEAAQLILDGQIVAFPTETVYGLGASLFSNDSIEKLFEVKKRSLSKAFTAHICDLSQVNEVARDLPDEFFLLAKHFFPGPLTIVVKKHQNISSFLTGNLDTIGIRMPSHSLALKLIEKTGPIAGTSANISGYPCITEKEQLLKDFGSIAAFIDGGNIPCGVASTVISLVDPKNPILLRQGSLQFEEITKVLL